MTPESESNLRLEIGHVLFVDLVGYSKLLTEEQKARADAGVGFKSFLDPRSVTYSWV